MIANLKEFSRVLVEPVRLGSVHEAKRLICKSMELTASSLVEM